MKDFLLYLTTPMRHPTFWLFQALIWTLVHLHGLPFLPIALCAAVANTVVDLWLYGEDA